MSDSVQTDYDADGWDWDAIETGLTARIETGMAMLARYQVLAEGVHR